MTFQYLEKIRKQQKNWVLLFMNLMIASLNRLVLIKQQSGRHIIDIMNERRRSVRNGHDYTSVR